MKQIVSHVDRNLISIFYRIKFLVADTSLWASKWFGPPWKWPRLTTLIFLKRNSTLDFANSFLPVQLYACAGREKTLSNREGKCWVRHNHWHPNQDPSVVISLLISEETSATDLTPQKLLLMNLKCGSLRASMIGERLLTLPFMSKGTFWMN